MDMETATTTQAEQADWQARVDLAAVYRLLAHHGWGDVIFNHAAMRLPSDRRRFLIKRHELLYTEVTASNLVDVSMDDDLDEPTAEEVQQAMRRMPPQVLPLVAGEAVGRAGFFGRMWLGLKSLFGMA